MDAEMKIEVTKFLFLWSINIVIVALIWLLEFYTFDYCVTHTCGITTDFGWQHLVYGLTPLGYIAVPLWYATNIFAEDL